MNSIGPMLRAALFALAGGIYLWLGYVAAASPHPPRIALLAGLLPLAALAFAAAWQSRMRVPALALCMLAAVAILGNFERLRDHTALLYFVQHAGAMGLLALTFGSSLHSGYAQALCSRVAKLVTAGPLDENYLRYTWQVTLAWTLFFLTTGSLSVLLFFFGPIEWWSLLANVLTPILIGAMFAAEYFVRMRVLPDRPHMSIVETIQAYRKYRRSCG